MATRTASGGKAQKRSDSRQQAGAYPAGLSREQIVDLYYWMRLTRTLE